MFSKEADIFQPSFTPISPDDAQLYQDQDYPEMKVKKKTKKLIRKIQKQSEEELSEGEVWNPTIPLVPILYNKG